MQNNNEMEKILKVLRSEFNAEIRQFFNLKNKHQLSGGYVYQENLNAVWMKE